MGEQLTESDVKKIKEEIEYRKIVVRKKELEAVKEARAQGDLSENFEYKAAKNFKNENEREHFLNKKKSFILKNEYLTQLYELSGNLKRDKSTNRNELESKLKKIEKEIKTTSDEIEKLRNQIEALQESDDFPHANYSEAWEYLNDICDNLCREKDAKNVFFWQQASLIMFSAVAFLLEYTYIDKDTGELKHLEDEQINFQNIKLILQMIRKQSQLQKWKHLTQ